jgi:hypothetical protein
MNVGELRELLEGIDDNVEVRLATQPNYPLEFHLSESSCLCTPDVDDEDLTEVEAKEAREDGQVFYLAEGQSLGYLSGFAAEQLGWR